MPMRLLPSFGRQREPKETAPFLCLAQLGNNLYHFCSSATVLHGTSNQKTFGKGTGLYPGRKDLFRQWLARSCHCAPTPTCPSPITLRSSSCLLCRWLCLVVCFTHHPIEFYILSTPTLYIQHIYIHTYICTMHICSAVFACQCSRNVFGDYIFLFFGDVRFDFLS